jgi:aminoglycoside phosphotransferase (APT) family kinase protein
MHVDVDTRSAWLLIGWLDGAVGITTAGVDALHAAARWIASFHSVNEKRQVSDNPPGFMRFDREYYAMWVERTLRFASADVTTYAQLAPLAKLGDTWMIPLLEAPPTVIHGEFYVDNILSVNGHVYPIDWESAASAPGEIDLASLTDRFSDDVARSLIGEYVASRWPDGTPTAFEQRLRAARLYFECRWLGDKPGVALRSRAAARLRSAAALAASFSDS